MTVHELLGHDEPLLEWSSRGEKQRITSDTLEKFPSLMFGVNILLVLSKYSKFTIYLQT